MAIQEKICTKPHCFFCIIKEQDSSIRRASIDAFLKRILFLDVEELILVVSGLWNIAMTRPDDQELPSLGIFECMASLIARGINNREWLFTHQNVYIPYYAAHIIGSYTMNKVESAVRAVESGVVPPLLELLRGKMSWVEQRVAVRALGHLASYEKTFGAVSVYEDEVVKIAMHLASSCLEVVYNMFVGLEDRRKRLKYHCDLLTRGVGGVETENRKAEEWASQMQCWSIHLLNCFAVKERCVDLMCKKDFLEDLCGMWGGLVNHTSPTGIGLLRILCYTKIGRGKVSESRNVLVHLCNLSRSSDDWQYMAIDCLLLLLKDLDTRYKVIEITTSCLIDLVELKNLGNRSNLGGTITRALVYDFKHQDSKIIKNTNTKRAMDEARTFKIERRKKERIMSREKLEGRRIIANLIKQEGNHKFSLGEIEEAMSKYTEALELCPLRQINERMAIYSNRAQCNFLLGDLDMAISDATRALCLSNPPNSHANSLWTRSQAYDMKGMAKESLMDCILFINVNYMKSRTVRIPYYAVRMICKQMESTWLFRDAQLKASNDLPGNITRKSYRNSKDNKNDEGSNSTDAEMKRIQMQNRDNITGLSTILEEPLAGNGSKKMERNKGSNKIF